MKIMRFSSIEVLSDWDFVFNAISVSKTFDIHSLRWVNLYFEIFLKNIEAK